MKNDYYLAHYGVLGMRWGVRKSRPSSGRSKISAHFHKKKKERIKKKNAKKAKRNQQRADLKKKLTPVSKMSEKELRRRIDRKKLEQEYKKLNRETKSEGRKFVEDVLSKSAKNIAEQATTYAMGYALNKVAGSNIVNPKKGQKDK